MTQDAGVPGEDSDLIRMTREVLASGTDYARSLEANIRSFGKAISTETSLRGELEKLRNDVREIQGSIVDIKAAKEVLSEVDRTVEKHTLADQPERRKVMIEVREILGKSPFARNPKPPGPGKISGSPGSNDKNP